MAKRNNKTPSPPTDAAPVPSHPAQGFDQAAIDAALNGAVTDINGNPVKTKPTRQLADPIVGCQEKNSNDAGANTIAREPTKKDLAEGKRPTPRDVDKFAVKCYELDITAKECHEESSKTHDGTIDEYLREINKKIYNEVRQGGYSTNVQFKVVPTDWVNVSHIIDWYRARGFVVEVKETTTSPFGKDVGTMNHNFTISWAVNA